MYAVMITTKEGQEAEPVGPFQSFHWAGRYVERMSTKGYLKLEIFRMISPVILDVEKTLDPNDDLSGIVFDPANGIDR